MRLIATYATAALVTFSAAAFAQDTVQPGDFGVVEAPAAGSKEVPLILVPRPILHTARVAFKTYPMVVRD